jgi:hypothetical protein
LAQAAISPSTLPDSAVVDAQPAPDPIACFWCACRQTPRLPNAGMDRFGEIAGVIRSGADARQTQTQFGGYQSRSLLAESTDAHLMRSPLPLGDNELVS